jgi:hypothetical protein
MATTSFGSSARTSSIKGAIKQALCKLERSQIDALAVTASQEEISAECSIPPYEGKVIHFTPVVTGSLPYMNLVDMFKLRNREDFGSPDLCARITESIKSELDASDGPLTVLLFYYCASTVTDALHNALEKLCFRVDGRFFGIRSVTDCNQNDFEKLDKKRTNIILVNGVTNNAGLNLQIADICYMIGELPANICKQMLGRAQRPPRSSKSLHPSFSPSFFFNYIIFPVFSCTQSLSRTIKIHKRTYENVRSRHNIYVHYSFK